MNRPIPRRTYEILVTNIQKGPLFSSDSTVITIDLSFQEVREIYEAINNKQKWILIQGRCVLNVSEIRRVVEVRQDDV